MNESDHDDINIVLGSAGRRVYLVDWFRRAFEQLGIKGNVIVADNDPTCASYSAGDISWHLPKYSAPNYRDEIIRLVEAHRPLAYISLNDYELVALRDVAANGLDALGVVVPGVSAPWMKIAADKFLMCEKLDQMQIPTPRTVLANDESGVRELLGDGDRWVVKHRLGSASSGLYIADVKTVNDAIKASAKDAPLNDSWDPLSGVVLQEYKAGAEYGVDIVASLSTPGLFRGALARRKIGMRAGETDKATTVCANDFEYICSMISSDALLTGIMDIDVIKDAESRLSVIDINPRFGGGYPFMHVAGANVPLMYLQELLGKEVDDSLLRYQNTVTSSKYQDIRITGCV